MVENQKESHHWTHGCHRVVTHVHASVLWKIDCFLGEIERFRGLDMAKMPYLIHGNPSFQNIQFGETKVCVKTFGLQHFSETGNI